MWLLFSFNREREKGNYCIFGKQWFGEEVVRWGEFTGGICRGNYFLGEQCFFFKKKKIRGFPREPRLDGPESLVSKSENSTRGSRPGIGVTGGLSFFFL